MRMTVALAVACVAVGLCVADESDAAVKRYELDIPRQTLDTALKELAQQTGLQIARFSDNRHGSVMVGPVSGEVSAQVALETLLAPSGLTYQVVNERTIAVMEAGSGGSASSTDSAEKEKMAPMSGAARYGDAGLLAQATPRTGTGAQDSESQRAALSDAGHPRHPGADIEEIVVTGSNIRGVGAVGTLSMTFTQDELSRTGYSTVGDFLASLPQNLNEITQTGNLGMGQSLVASTNVQGATSVSLRGLGPGSTLVLLNGKRRPGNVNGRAFDVSAIPFSMVERIEVLTGGRSGIYGSDAVAGVVNIVTVRELDGAASRAYYGASSAGGERLNFNQTWGREFDDGGFVLGYQYRKAWSLDATDAGVVRGQSPLGITPIPGLLYLRNPSEQHVGLFSGHYELGRNAELYADAHYSSQTKESRFAYNRFSLFDLGLTKNTESDQYSATGGVRLDVGDNWQVDLSALYGVVDNAQERNVFSLPPGTLASFDVAPTSTNADDDKATLTSFSAIADGPVGKVWNASVSAAVGIDFRNESYRRISVGSTSPEEDIERDIWAIFVEMHVPVIDDGDHQLALSVAGRYDHYSDVGGTFNPQLGLEWSPIGGLSFRGSWATAFRAPDLYALDVENFVFVRSVNDPLAADGTTTLLSNFGGNPDLEPEEADTWTIGVDWQPSDRAKLSISYFRVDYRGRITEPTTDSHTYITALQDEALYPGLIDRSPTAEELDTILDRQSFFVNGTDIPFDPDTDEPLVTFPDIVLFDDRSNNIALETIDGLDVQASAALEARSGDWSLGLNGTYYFDYVRNITVAAPAIGRLNQPGGQIDFRLRGHVGWSKVGWSVNTYVNYVDDYADTFAATPTEIDSWTTVDLTLSYELPTNADRRLLNGLEATFGVNNVFDEDPPVFLNNSYGLAFDPVNANAIGRLVSLRISKRW